MHRRVLRPLRGALAAAGVLGLCLAACGPRPELRPIRFEQWKQELASLRGRVVVVDVWATWCVPCLERFPHVVDLDRRYRNRGVTVVSLSVDNRDDPQAVEEARRFLRRQNAAFPNYLMDENILEAFEKLDLLTIPAVWIYDRSGRLRHDLNGDDPNRQFTDDDVERAVAALAAE